MLILNLTQHAATPEQVAAGVFDPAAPEKAELERLLTFTEAPDESEIHNRVMSIALLARKIADRNIEPVPKVMIGGAGFLMGTLAAVLARFDFEVFHAFTQRESVEQTQPDGSVRKVQVFRHAGFVRDPANRLV